MTIQHKGLANGRWAEFSLVEQMANIGSEVGRALNWKSKNNAEYCRKAIERALELIDFTIDDLKNRTRLKEILRMREVLVDYFYDSNQYGSSESSWKKYFYYFGYAARKKLGRL